jgi:hypothetical protein
MVSDTGKINTEYLKKGLNILNNAKALIKESDWSFEANVDGIIMESKEFTEDSYVPCYRISCDTLRPLNELIEMAWNVDQISLQKDDPDVLKWEILESGNNWRIVTMVNDMPWPLSAREVVIFQSIYKDNEGIWLVSYSVPHDSVPESDKYVRATVHLSVYGFVRSNNNINKIYRLSLIDPNGSIPTFVVKLFADKLMEPLNKWK